VEKESEVQREQTRSKSRLPTTQQAPARKSILAMHYTRKIATINVNGIASHTRLEMLGGFLRGHDIDIALLQEVTNDNFASIRSYTAFVNEGSEQRGTAILSKEGLPLHNIKRLPSERGIAAMFMGIWIINIYAPSGAERRVEREQFFNSDITYLLPSNPDILLAGDFNCVVSLTDCTGRKNVSTALVTLITGLCLHDVWTMQTSGSAYTHYTNDGTSRLDRIYVTHNLRNRKQGAETVAAAFTGHLAVLVRLTFHKPSVMSFNGHWRMNITLMNDTSCRATIQELWGRWKRNVRFYPTRVLWWERYFKVKLRQAFQREGAARNKDGKELENFYYEVIYQVLKDPSPNENKAITLRKLNAEIIRLHSLQKRGVLLDTDDKDRLLGEDVTIHHYVKSRKR
jgi:exonuclease III